MTSSSWPGAGDAVDRRGGASSKDQEDSWGWFVTNSSPVQVYNLDIRDLVVGRHAESCRLVVDEEMFDAMNHDFGGEDFVRISRRHLTISKSEGEVRAVLTDLSLNGTWVDGVKVGKGRQIILNHCSVVALLGQEWTCFQYLDRNIMEATFHQCITSKYLVGRELGSGTTSTVRAGYKIVDDNKVRQFALKMIQRKEEASQSKFPIDSKIEVKIMKGLNHPCLLKIHEVLKSDTDMVIVMDLASGGELFDLVHDHYLSKTLSESSTKIYFYQIVHCVNYLHSNQVCHRDLKLENILLANDDDISQIKIIDFGLSKTWRCPKDPLVTYVGTPVYMAPEVTKLEKESSDIISSTSTYTSKVDCWSLGVILYTMLSGKRPFTSGLELEARIMSGRYRPMDGKEWVSISKAAKHLVKKLLEVDPEARLSTSQILDHPWFVEDEGSVNYAKKIMFGKKYLGEE